jgi:hypothetical protein
MTLPIILLLSIEPQFVRTVLHHLTPVSKNHGCQSA